MLEDFMTPEKFQGGLTSYLTSHQYGNAKTEDLWKALDQATGGQLHVPDVMATWTRQMGFPVVHVTRAKDKITLTQSRYLTSVDLKFNETESPYKYVNFMSIQYSMHSENVF